EDIFQIQLQQLVVSDQEIAQQLSRFNILISDKEALVDNKRKELRMLQKRIDGLFELYHEEKLPKADFTKYYTPLAERHTQIEQSLPTLLGEIDYLRNHYHSQDQVLAEAKDLYHQWSELTFSDKREIIETLTESIIIGKDDLEINLHYIPSQAASLKELTTKGTHTPKDSVIQYS
ncbi:MAG: hypothetical protein AAF206_31370, partial [Bacteroidota bacterium]